MQSVTEREFSTILHFALITSHYALMPPTHARWSEAANLPRAAEIDATSFNRVGNAPRVQRRGIVFRRKTRGALPTRLNESFLTARGVR